MDEGNPGAGPSRSGAGRSELSIDIVNSVTAIGRALRKRAPASEGAIGLGELGVLRAVAGRDGARPSAIAEDLGVDLSVVSRRLPALEAAGLIERVADPGDRRSQLVTLTPAGAARLAELGATTGEVIAARLGGWDRSELEQLAQLLRRLEQDLTAG